jgi:sugar/nucleoside kinase (ribokinase family)
MGKKFDVVALGELLIDFLHQVLEKGLRVYSAEELEGMLTFANAAASIVTTRKGALRVMPTMEEIQNQMCML